MSKLYKIGCFIFCLLFLHCLVASAQQASGTAIVVRGKVLDKKTKGAMQGVTVSEVDADGRFVKGTTTDIEGNYSLKIINAKNKISVSYVGYKPTTASINGRSSIDFLLEMSGADFEEDDLSIRGEKFKDASIFYNNVSEIKTKDLKRWLKKSTEIQWDYKNIVKRKGRLERLK